MWIKLGKHSNNCLFHVETPVDKTMPKTLLFSYLLATGCGKQIAAKL
jgi:hypothetical protein